MASENILVLLSVVIKKFGLIAKEFLSVICQNGVVFNADFEHPACKGKSIKTCFGVLPDNNNRKTITPPLFLMKLTHTCGAFIES